MTQTDTGAKRWSDVSWRQRRCRCYASDTDINTSFPFFIIGFKNYYILKLEASCLTMSCQFLLHGIVDQLYVYIPSLLSLPPAPHPTPLGHHGAPGWALCLTHSFPPAVCLTHGSVYMSRLLSQLAPPLFPALVHKSALCDPRRILSVTLDERRVCQTKQSQKEKNRCCMLMCMCFIYISNLEKYLLIDYDSLRQKPLDLHLVKQYPFADKPVQD